MKWLARLLNRVYTPKQHLNEKQLEILDTLDSRLTALSATMPAGAVMSIKTAEIGIFYSVKPIDTIVDAVLTVVPMGYSYIPRSVAFFIDEQGSWCYLIAVREVGELDPLVAKMYTQLLARTNDARSN